jgi:FKBP-type peptidyl-prolyl cis-trans isomerase (trigger factor)
VLRRAQVAKLADAIGLGPIARKGLGVQISPWAPSMISAIQKHEDGTIELTVTVPADLIAKAREEVIVEHVKEAELPGFRKGMAPRDLVEKSLNQDHLREDTLRKLLPQGYIEAVQSNKINPVLNPKIHVEKLEDGKDWVFKAFTAEAPIVTLKDYKTAVKKVTAASKIVVPGKESQPVSFETIAKALLESADVKIPSIITDQEVDRLLSQTLDDVKKLGMSLDQYLASTGRNSDALRAEYALKAETDIKLEFILLKIAETEGIKVEEQEIDEAIAQAKDDAERQNLTANRHILTSIIRQQKTLDFLRSL